MAVIEYVVPYPLQVLIITTRVYFTFTIAPYPLYLLSTLICSPSRLPTCIVSLLSFSSRNGAPLPTYIVSIPSSSFFVHEWSATTYIVTLLSFSSRNGARPTVSSLSPPLLAITITHLHRLSSLLLVREWSTIAHLHRLSSLLLVQEWSATTDAWD
jgi:hypothetical protein